ncbi:MAG: ABC transporter substrate-binding protein [Myxococcales bacterium]|nr:ABC transporter substrate-binding protein [Myxococcales bacterium]
MLVATALLAHAAPACVAERPPREPGVITVSAEQQTTWVRNFNPFLQGTRWPTTAGIHEPLMVWSSTQARYVPWLATAADWDGPRTLRVTLRPGVRWSDGRPFGPRDVAFTFDLVHRAPGLDQRGVWGFLDRVEVAGPDTVVFHLKRPFVPGFHGIVGLPMVPEHVWKDVADPLRFTDPVPVGTGPFTEVVRFENQVYEIGRNPHYWGGPGRPGLTRLRMPVFPSNDQALLGLLTGDLDWAGNFVPAVDRLFVDKDPSHNHYWFPLVGNTVFLYLNTAKPPFDDVRLRRAFSQALDRDRIVDIAMLGTTRPTDGTALSDAFPTFRDPDVAKNAPWLPHDPAAAGAALDAAGYPLGEDGVRVGPDDAPLSYELTVVAGWSDWVRAAQLIKRDLEAVGVAVRVRTLDFSPWFEGLQTGRFDLTIGWSVDGPTPYPFYRGLMSAETRKPVGESAAQNWHRFASPEADRLLTAFESATDPDEQIRLAHALEAEFSASLPAIPLFPGPSWAVYSTRHATGFPSPDDPYAPAAPRPASENLLVLVNLAPAAPPEAAPR